jgi:hypothetical protein
MRVTHNIARRYAVSLGDLMTLFRLKLTVVWLVNSVRCTPLIRRQDVIKWMIKTNRWPMAMSNY